MRASIGALVTATHSQCIFFPASFLGHFYFNDFLILNLSIIVHHLWEPKAAFMGALDKVVAMEAKVGEEQGSFWKPNLSVLGMSYK